MLAECLDAVAISLSLRSIVFAFCYFAVFSSGNASFCLFRTLDDSV